MATDEQLLQGALLAPEGVEFTRLPERALPYWRIKMIVNNLIGCALSAALIWLIAIFWLDLNWWLMGLCGVFLLRAVWMWGRLRVGWRIAAYSLGAEEISVRDGISTRSITTAPYGRIQNVEVYTTFWGRRFNLASVEVNTGLRSAVCISSIDPGEAERIRALLSDMALNRGVQL